jgi:hypothetical protein
MVKQGKHGIIIREYKAGRISITADKDLLKDIDRWASGFGAEHQEPAAIEVVQAISEYNKNEKNAKAHSIYKMIKSHKITKLTDEQRNTIRGTKYEGYLYNIGWL